MNLLDPQYALRFGNMVDFDAYNDEPDISAIEHLPEATQKLILDAKRDIDNGARAADELARMRPDKKQEILSQHRDGAWKILRTLMRKHARDKGVLQLCRFCNRCHLVSESCFYCEQN